MTGPGVEEEIEEYGTRCRECGCIVWTAAPDDYGLCRECWLRKREAAKKPTAAGKKT